jgi:hypothetical protein
MGAVASTHSFDFAQERGIEEALAKRSGTLQRTDRRCSIVKKTA